MPSSSAPRSGTLVGTITAGSGGDTRKPFTTNATGVATGLNADRVDGLHAGEIISAARAKAGLDADTLDGIDSSGFVSKSERLFAVVDAAHTGIVRSSGGVGFAEGAPDNGRVDVVFPRDITACAYVAGVSSPDETFAVAAHAKVDQVESGTTNTLRITTFDDNPAPTAAEHPFHVIVLC